MSKTRWILLLACVFALSSPSCSKKIGCPVNSDNTPKFDGTRYKSGKAKSGIKAKTKKYKKRRH